MIFFKSRYFNFSFFLFFNNNKPRHKKWGNQFYFFKKLYSGNSIIYSRNAYSFSYYYLLKNHSIILMRKIINTINFNLQIFNQNYNSGYIFIDEYIRNLIYLENDYALNYLTYFPFDFLIKILASMKNILQLPFIYKLPPPGIDNQLILTFYEIKYNFLFIFKYIIFLVTLYSFFILLRQYKYSGFLCIILFCFSCLILNSTSNKTLFLFQ